MGWPEDIVLDQKEDPSTDHAGYDGNPSLLWFTMMDIHPKSVVMDIHAPSRLFIATIPISKQYELDTQANCDCDCMPPGIITVHRYY